MESNRCAYGLLLAEMRAERGITQWQLAVAANYHIRNLQRIEKGDHDPGVTLAVRMVAALGVPVGDFFRTLGQAVDLPVGLEHSKLLVEFVNSIRKGDELPESKYLFGKLFHTVRMNKDVSQKIIAEKAGYHLRNIARVEKGTQEPSVMTALRMVSATGCEVGPFFQTLHTLLQKP